MQYTNYISVDTNTL